MGLQEFIFFRENHQLTDFNNHETLEIKNIWISNLILFKQLISIYLIVKYNFQMISLGKLLNQQFHIATQSHFKNHILVTIKNPIF